MSDVYLLHGADEAYVLKVYLRGRHSRSEIEAEVSVANALVAQGVPVAAPLPDRDGAYLSALHAAEGTRFAVLSRAITGAAPLETNLAHSRAFGQVAARLHACADGLPAAYDRPHLDKTYLVDATLAVLRPHFPTRSADLDYMASLGSDLMSEVNRLLSREAPEYGLCHGDLHTGNARFDGSGQLTLFDLDSLGYGWRALDIGVYHVSYDWLGLGAEVRAEKARFWSAFVDGYNSVRTLGRNELTVAQLCQPIRHLELMGLTIRYWSPQTGAYWIDDAYLDGHLRWLKEWEAGWR